MSVYKHIYRAYERQGNSRCGHASSCSHVMDSLRPGRRRLRLALFTLCLLPPIVFLVMIYLANNPIARALIMAEARGPDDRCSTSFSSFWKSNPGLRCLGLVDRASSDHLRPCRQRAADPAQSSHLALRLCLRASSLRCSRRSRSSPGFLALLLFAYQGYSSPLPWTAANLQHCRRTFCRRIDLDCVPFHSWPRPLFLG